MLSFPSKIVGEDIIAKFDFFSDVPFGEVLSSPVVTVSVHSGVDFAPSAILSGVATFPVMSPEVAEQKIIDGKPGVVYALRCQATGSGGKTYQQVKLLAVLSNEGGFSPSALPSISGILPDGVVGAPYTAPLTISGGYPPYYPDPLQSGPAPTWMGFTVVDNLLHCAGVPNEPDPITVYNFAPQIHDSALNVASVPETITIRRITLSGDLGNGRVGNAVNYQYVAANGTPPYTYAISGGALPAGTSMSAGGLVTGNYTTVSVNAWEVTALDVNLVPAILPDSNIVEQFIGLYASLKDDNDLLLSEDGGFTWPIAINSGGAIAGGSPTGVKTLCFGGGGRLFRFVFSGTQSGRTSANGTTFVTVTGLPVNRDPLWMIWTGAEWLLGTDFGIYFSTNGTNFALRAGTASGRGVAQNGLGTIIANASSVGVNFLQRSIDNGLTWTNVNTLSPNLSSFVAICWSGTRFVALPGDTPNPGVPSISSPDGFTWSPWGEMLGTSRPLYLERNTDNDSLLMMNQDGELYHSLNGGAGWLFASNQFLGKALAPAGRPESALFYAQGLFFFSTYATVPTGEIWTSPQGVNWTLRATTPFGYITSFTEFSF